MNIATLTGVIIGLSVLAGAMLEATENISIFFNPRGLAIVIGGVVGSSFICHSLEDMFGVFKSMIKVFHREDQASRLYIQSILDCADMTLTGNLKAIETKIAQTNNAFLREGLQMVLDQYPEKKMRSLMRFSIQNAKQKVLNEAQLLRTMAKLAPAFGMVGTLIGLIVMFQSMDENFSNMGKSLALAMMTTLYGILLANLVFFPMAVKLEGRIASQVQRMVIIMEGCILISKRTPPDLVKSELEMMTKHEQWKAIGK
ncbi:MAG: motility protein A [Methylobacter sp.]